MIRYIASFGSKTATLDLEFDAPADMGQRYLEARAIRKLDELVKDLDAWALNAIRKN